MGIVVREARTKRERREFVALACRLHRGHPLWIPPLLRQEKLYVHPSKNPQMAGSKTVCFLAEEGGRTVGRVMALTSGRIAEHLGDPHARFCSFECVDRQDAAHALLGAAEAWARKNGAERIVGPLGFSNQDPQGFLVEGFDERPSINTIVNYPYVPRLVEKEGYTKEVDYVTLKVPIPDAMPELYLKISERLARKSEARLLEFRGKREVRRRLPEVLRFMNEAYRGIYGFVPLTEEAIRKASRNYMAIVDPGLLKIVLDREGRIAGFVLGVRDLTDGLRKAKGRLFPFGYFALKASQRRAKRLDLLLGAIKEEHRNKGFNTLMAIAMIESARSLGLTHVDTHHELETNTLVQAEMKRLGGVVCKRHRVYQKSL